MALPKEVIDALNQGQQESEDYRIEDCWHGWLIYKNLIDSPNYRATFFPYSKPQDPIIAEPITSSIINRLVSALRKHATYKATVNKQDATQELNLLLESLSWHQLSMDALAKTLATGGQLFWFSQSKDAKSVQVNLIQPFYAGKVFDDAYDEVGYYQSYTTDTRTMLSPIDKLSNQNSKTVIKYVDSMNYYKWVDSKLVIQQAHNLPFLPAVWADSVDLDENGHYGVPYCNRFKNLLMQLNATLSQKQKSLVMLQNVWIAKSQYANAESEEPLSLTPDTINYLEQDGSLEQVVRNLDLTEESNQVEYLKKAIYKSAQVPVEDGVTGNLESGVALRILYSQLEEIVSRLRDNWIRTEEEVLSKAFRYQRLLNGKSDPKDQLKIEVVYDSELVPEDAQHKLDIELRLLENNLITRESLIRKYNKTEEEISLLLAEPAAPVKQFTPPENGAI